MKKLLAAIISLVLFTLTASACKFEGASPDSALLLIRATVYSPSGEEISRKEYGYDGDGLPSYILEFYNKTLTQWTYGYQYDKNGNEIMRKVETVAPDNSAFDSLDKSESSNSLYYKSEYDKKGNMISSKNFDSNMNLVRNFIYEYDKNGNMVKYYSETASGFTGLEICVNCEYDENGNMTKLSHDLSNFYGNMPSEILMYEYDDNQRITKQNNYFDSTLSSYLIYEYDENGALVKTSELNSNDELVGYTVYEYK